MWTCASLLFLCLQLTFKTWQHHGWMQKSLWSHPCEMTAAFTKPCLMPRLSCSEDDSLYITWRNPPWTQWIFDINIFISFQVLDNINWCTPSAVLIMSFCSRRVSLNIGELCFYGRCKWSKRISRHLSWGWRRGCERVEQYRIFLYTSVCLSVCANTCLMYVCVCLCVCLGRVLFVFLFLCFSLCKSNVQWASLTLTSCCAVWGMPVGWLLLTWPTPRDSRSVLRFSPMPRTSSKTWLSPITGLFWMAWPRTGATLTPLSRDAASWMACPTERGRSTAWKRTQWRRRDLTVGDLFLWKEKYHQPAPTRASVHLDCC